LNCAAAQPTLLSVYEPAAVPGTVRADVRVCRRQRQRAGLTVVEIAAVVSAVGMLLAVALPTLSQTIRVSKVTEASEQLEALYRATAAYYAQARVVAGQTGRERELVHCLPAPAGPTPELPSPSPVPVDFAHASAPSAATWTALQFAPSAALRFRYSFLPAVSGCSVDQGGTNLLILRAEGDLDGDGVYSQFERRAQIAPLGQLNAEAVLHIQDRVE
jgi:type II secretory pathway pseudopilin PulG